MVDSEPSWRAKFKKERLIFIPEPKPHWWSTDEVFWEDESPVFGDARGYLKAHYSENLSSFFTNSLKVSERADTLDYIRGIEDMASKGQTGTKEIRERLQKLYRRLWLSLQEDEDSLKDEECQEEPIRVYEYACWLGKKGDEWGFFSSQELVWKDDGHRSELFKNKIPFWAFDNDLLELAKELGIKGCYQDSDVKFDYCGSQEEDTNWSAKVHNLSQNICDFLNSPHLHGEHGEEKSSEILDRLSVRRVEKLDVRFELKGISVPDPHPRQSFLEETGEGATLWLASEANENQYAWLIGDALQDYFGDVKELSAFVEDLLTKDKGNVLTRWKQKGLQTNTYILLPERNSKNNEEDRKASINDKLPNESSSGNANARADESIVETLIVNETSAVNNGDVNSATTESGTSTYAPSRTGDTSRSGGHSISTSSIRRGGGGHGGSGGGGEGEEHGILKKDLANNPAQFGEGLENWLKLSIHSDQVIG